MGREPEYVILVDGRIRAEVVSQSAHFARVQYTRGGIDYDVLITNEEYYIEGETNIDDAED